jgi:hypothetical protein
MDQDGFLARSIQELEIGGHEICCGAGEVGAQGEQAQMHAPPLDVTDAPGVLDEL